MLGEVAARAYQWQQPFRTDHGDFDAAFPGAVRPTAQGDAVAAAAWFDNRQETAR